MIYELFIYNEYKKKILFKKYLIFKVRNPYK